MATTTTRAAPRNQQKMAQPQPQQQNAVAVIPPRLPYIDEVKEHFKGIVTGEPEWRALVESIFPLAKTPQSVSMALAYCARRKLDPFKRVCHIVPVWSSAAGKMVEQVWPGIAELRTTATRTGLYAGMDVPQFGEFVTSHYKGKVQNYDKSWREVEAEVTYPEWCQITLYRIVAGHRVPFPGPKVYFSEVFSRMGRFADVPNDKWQKSPVQMLEKVSESAALRRAFPEEVGDERAIEEYNDAEGEGENAWDVTNEGSASTAPATMPKREDYQPKAQEAQQQPAQAQEEQKPATQAARPAQPQQDQRSAAQPAESGALKSPSSDVKGGAAKDAASSAASTGKLPPHDQGTGEIIEGTATHVEEPLAGNELDEGQEGDAALEEDVEPPPEHAKPEQKLAFPRFTKVSEFADWAEGFLGKTNAEGARQFLDFYDGTLIAMDRGKTGTQEAAAWIRATAKEIIDPPAKG